MNVTIQDIRDLNPCYDPVTGKDSNGDVVRTSGLLPEDWTGTRLDILNVEDCPIEDRIWVGTGLLPDKEARLYGCWCVRYTPLYDGRTVWDLLTDERSRNAIEVAERFALGKANLDELEEAREAAWDVSWGAWGVAWVAWAARAGWAAGWAARGTRPAQAAQDARVAALAVARAAWAARPAQVARDAQAAQLERLKVVCAELEGKENDL